MKVFFSSLPPAPFSSAKASHASSRLPSLIFSLLFLLSCPHSIYFHSTLRSLYSCFHFNPISQSSATLIFCNPFQSFHKRSDKLFLTSSTCLSSFSGFFQPHMPYFSFNCSLPRLFLSAFLSTHSLPLCQMRHLSVQSQQSPPWTN